MRKAVVQSALPARPPQTAPPAPVVRQMLPARHHPSRCHVIEVDNPSEETIQVSVRCPMCGGTSRVVVPRARYLAWVGGGPFWTNFQGVDPITRELLLTGIGAGCWDRIFENGPDGAKRLMEVLSAGVARRTAQIAVNPKLLGVIGE